MFHEVEDGKRVLREIRLLSFLNHENLLTITDLLPPRSKDFQDVYIVTPLMDTDMNNVLRSRQQLDDNHYQYFIYQVCLHTFAADTLPFASCHCHPPTTTTTRHRC